MALLETLRELGSLEEAGEASVAESLLKSIGEASQSEALSAILDDAQVFTTREGLTINGVRLGEFQQMIREGSLVKLARAMKSTAYVDKEAETSFAEFVGAKTPDREMAQLQEAIRAQREINVNLNIKASTGPELERQLDAEAESKLSKIWTRLKKVAGASKTIPLWFGLLYLGNKMHSCLADYMKQCDGCYLATKHPDGSITCCKIRNRMCSATDSASCEGDCDDKALHSVRHSNVNPLIFLQDVVSRKDSKALDAIKARLALPKDFIISETNSISLLRDAKFASAVERVMLDTVKNQYDEQSPCGKLRSYTGKCICCDPGAPKNSAEYASVSSLPVECSLFCKRDTRLTDVLVELSAKLKEDILEAAEGVFHAIVDALHLRWVLYFLLTVVTLIATSFLLRFTLVVKSFFTALTST